MIVVQVEPVQIDGCSFSPAILIGPIQQRRDIITVHADAIESTVCSLLDYLTACNDCPGSRIKLHCRLILNIINFEEVLYS